jgi:hypothetical protein
LERVGLVALGPRALAGVDEGLVPPPVQGVPRIWVRMSPLFLAAVLVARVPALIGVVHDEAYRRTARRRPRIER